MEHRSFIIFKYENSILNRDGISGKSPINHPNMRIDIERYHFSYEEKSS